MEEFEQDNPNWIQSSVSKKKNIIVYSSPWNYFPNVNFLTKNGGTNLKINIDFFCSFEETILAVYSNYHRAYSNIHILDYKFSDYCLLQSQLKMNFIFQKRFGNFVHKMFYDPQRQVILRIKSVKYQIQNF